MFILHYNFLRPLVTLCPLFSVVVKRPYHIMYQSLLIELIIRECRSGKELFFCKYFNTFLRVLYRCT